MTFTLLFFHSSLPLSLHPSLSPSHHPSPTPSVSLSLSLRLSLSLSLSPFYSVSLYLSQFELSDLLIYSHSLFVSISLSILSRYLTLSLHPFSLYISLSSPLSLSLSLSLPLSLSLSRLLSQYPIGPGNFS